MTAHRYWKLGDLTATSPSFNAVSMAECYLRATVGGSNIVPVAFATSSNAGTGFEGDKSYDGNAATLWGSASSTNGVSSIAYDYGSAITPGALFMQARGDTSPYYNQTPVSGNLYYSDTGLTGPWTLAHSISFGAWTTLGQTQEQDLTLITAGVHVQKAQALAVARYYSNGIIAQKAVALALVNVPTVSMQVQQAVAIPVVRANATMEVQKAVALVVGLGRVANPHVRPWTFTMDGHDFLVIKTYSMTLIYDFEAAKWYTWGIGDSAVWPPQVGQNWNANLGVIMPNFGNETQTNVICGDEQYDTLYFLDPELVDDHAYNGATGQQFLRVITGQIVVRGHDYEPCPSVELTGSNGEAPVGANMSVELKVSDDRGHTYWSAGVQTVVQGTYDVTLTWQALGSFTGPGRLFRFTDYGAVYRVDGMDIVDGQ